MASTFRMFFYFSQNTRSPHPHPAKAHPPAQTHTAQSSPSPSTSHSRPDTQPKLTNQPKHTQSKHEGGSGEVRCGLPLGSSRGATAVPMSPGPLQMPGCVPVKLMFFFFFFEVTSLAHASLLSLSLPSIHSPLLCQHSPFSLLLPPIPTGASPSHLYPLPLRLVVFPGIIV